MSTENIKFTFVEHDETIEFRYCVELAHPDIFNNNDATITKIIDSWKQHAVISDENMIRHTFSFLTLLWFKHKHDTVSFRLLFE